MLSLFWVSVVCLNIIRYSLFQISHPQLSEIFPHILWKDKNVLIFSKPIINVKIKARIVKDSFLCNELFSNVFRFGKFPSVNKHIILEFFILVILLIIVCYVMILIFLNQVRRGSMNLILMVLVTFILNDVIISHIGVILALHNFINLSVDR
jgi:hypothetical protein